MTNNLFTISEKSDHLSENCHTIMYFPSINIYNKIDPEAVNVINVHLLSGQNYSDAVN